MVQPGWAQKGDKRFGIRHDFVNSPVGAWKVAVHVADLHCPETAAMLWGRWLFSVTVRLWATGLQRKHGEEGREAFIDSRPLLLYRACLLLLWGRGKKKNQQWINRQRTADNSVENTVAHFPAFYEFIRLHAVSPVISRSMQPIWSSCINSERGAGWPCRQIVCSLVSMIVVGGNCQCHLALFSIWALLSFQLWFMSSCLGLAAAAELTLHLCFLVSRPIRQADNEADWPVLPGPAPARPRLKGIRLTHLILGREESKLSS